MLEAKTVIGKGDKKRGKDTLKAIYIYVCIYIYIFIDGGIINGLHILDIIKCLQIKDCLYSFASHILKSICLFVYLFLEAKPAVV